MKESGEKQGLDIEAVVQQGPSGFYERNYLYNIISQFQENTEKIAQQPALYKELKNELDELLVSGRALVKQLENITPSAINLEQHIPETNFTLEKYSKTIEKFRNAYQRLLYEIGQDDNELVEALNNLLDRINENRLSSNMLIEPEGINGIAWLIHYKRQQDQEFETNQLLADLWDQISQYQEGDIEKVKKIIERISSFKSSHPEQIQPWLEGIRKECEMMSKRYQAMQIQAELDKADLELQDKLNKADLNFRKAHPNYTKLESEFENPKKSFFSFLSFLNIPKIFREYRYAKQKVDLLRLKVEIEKQHQSQHQDATQTQKEQLKKIKSESKLLKNSHIHGIALPNSFAEYQEAKKLVTQNHGIMIGGMAQNRMISLGSSGGLCYGFTKEWLLQMNALRELKDEHEIIDKLDLYTKKSTTAVDTLIQSINNLTLTDKTYQHYLNQTNDDKVKFHNRIPNSQFTQELFAILDKLSPPSVILSVGMNNKSHAIGIVQTEHGIWLNDSNSGCFYFPIDPDLNKARQNFAQFYNQYLNDYYPGFKINSYAHQPESKSQPILDTFDTKTKVEKTQEAELKGSSPKPSSPIRK